MRVLVVVPTEVLVNQWQEYVDKNDLVFNTTIKIINTVIKYDWKTDILILDEVHRYGATTFSQVFQRVQYKYILGLTATFERSDGMHELIEQYCPIIDIITTQEALINGWVSSYIEYQILINVDNISDYEELDKDFNKHFGFFSYNFELVMSLVGKNGFKNRLQLAKQMSNRKNYKEVLQQITYHATGFMGALQKRKAFINNHPKKAEIARKIIEARPNKKIITFSNNIKMAESIGIGCVYTGKLGNKKSRITIEEFQNMETGVINSCKKLNEGADLKGLSVAIILGLDSSKLNAIQRLGRAIRFEEEKKAEIFNIVIEDTVECSWFKKSHKNSNYITINEEGLNDLLEGKTPKPYLRPIKNFSFNY